jgi:hypothetical protein
MSGSEADAHANPTLQSAQDEEARLNRLIGLLHAARENTAVVKRARARDVVAAYREICRRIAAEKIPSRSS